MKNDYSIEIDKVEIGHWGILWKQPDIGCLLVKYVYTFMDTLMDFMLQQVKLYFCVNFTDSHTSRILSFEDFRTTHKEVGY